MPTHEYSSSHKVKLLFWITAISHIWSHIYLSKRGCNCQGLLQLKELADEVLFCKTQRLQLTEDLLKYLQRDTLHIISPCETHTVLFIPHLMVWLNVASLAASPCQTWSCRPHPSRRRTCCPCPAVRTTGNAGCWSPALSACSGLR